MKLVEALRSLKRIREAREELFRAFNDSEWFSLAEKNIIEKGIEREREKVIAQIKSLASIEYVVPAK